MLFVWNPHAIYKHMLIVQDYIKFRRPIAWQKFLVNNFPDFPDVGRYQDFVQSRLELATFCSVVFWISNISYSSKQWHLCDLVVITPPAHLFSVRLGLHVSFLECTVKCMTSLPPWHGTNCSTCTQLLWKQSFLRILCAEAFYGSPEGSENMSH